MELLKQKIQKEGTVIGSNILKVDSFLNHQLDVQLFNEIGKEFKRRFEGKEITKILTVEASGIGIACITAQYFNVPVVFGKKQQAVNMDPESYEAEVFSFTKKNTYQLKIAKRFLQPQDKILIIDDFLASGNVVQALLKIVKDAGAEVAGIGIVIEKAFQKGRDVIKDSQIQLESLACIEHLEAGKVYFREE